MVDDVTARAEQVEAERLYNRFEAIATDGVHDHWSKIAYWKIDEAVALVLNRNPRRVTWKLVRPFIRISAFARKYSDLRELALRAVETRQLQRNNRPDRFLAWTARIQIAVPARLDEAVRRIEPKSQLSDCENRLARVVSERDDALRRLEQIEADQKKMKGLGARERESLLKLVIGMAVAAYRYDPRDFRSKKISEIASDLERGGVPLDDDTVRKWLKEAAELLPPETEH